MNWKKLKVWQKCHSLVLKIYEITTGFPKEEVYGLTNQLRRSSASVPANIVEGQSRDTTKEYLCFLYNARGSVEETRYHIFLAKELGYLGNDKCLELEKEYEEVSKMLNGLIGSLRKGGRKD
ncbi:MAG TPA: four helix bundle protein [Actinobacteria bacterium]|nr:four helix bundle protein [Actinomycetota bacterium]